jgi:transposase
LGNKHKGKWRGKMRLTDFDLKQMDEAYLAARTPEQLVKISQRLLQELKEARDRLNRTPANSSKPPSSQAPWEKCGAQQEDEDQDTPGLVEPEEGSATAPAEAEPEVQGRQDEGCAGQADKHTPSGREPVKRSAGRQPGSAGYGRQQRIEATQHEDHRPPCCALCGEGWSGQTPSKAYTAYDEIDLAPREPQELGLRLSCTRHMLYCMTCSCGHQTRAQPYRADDDGLWESVELGEWRLVGPRLAALIVYFGLRMRLSHERIKELLWELFALHLAKGTIGQTIREAGRAAEPLIEAIAEEVRAAQLVYADETSWPEGSKLLWLWTMVTQNAVLFLIGLRNNEMIDNMLGRAFKGILMSDGYCAYRKFLNRLRCWAHLSRKLRGLAESTNGRVAQIGSDLQTRFLVLQNAIYAARASPDLSSPSVMYADDIASFKALCQQHYDDLHKGLRAVAREFLLDWEVIVCQLKNPHLPLTNNESERSLRHWVIARHLSHGTRTPSGSRAFSTLASIIETCRRRKTCSRTFLATVISHARRGIALPPLPCPVAP